MLIYVFCNILLPTILVFGGIPPSCSNSNIRIIKNNYGLVIMTYPNVLINYCIYNFATNTYIADIIQYNNITQHNTI